MAKKASALLTCGLLALVILGCAPNAHAAEGLWPLHEPNRVHFDRRLGTPPSRSVLDRAARAAVIIGPSCSGVQVSKNGLILTASHCVKACPLPASTSFIAESAQAERPCPDLMVARWESRQAIQAENPAPCPADHYCSPVSRDGHRYVDSYRRLGGVRLVFSPDAKLRDFGGVGADFRYPRYALDFALLRVDPDPSGSALSISKARRLPSVIYMLGSPLKTERSASPTRVALARDATLPSLIAQYEIAAKALRTGPNALLPIVRSQAEAFDDAALAPRATLADLLQRRAAWARAPLALDLVRLEACRGAVAGFGSAASGPSAALSAALIAAAQTEATWLEARPPLARSAKNDPLPPAADAALLEGWLTRLRDACGVDDVFVQFAFNGQAAGPAATRLLERSRLATVAGRQEIVSLSAKAMAALDDPLMSMARASRARHAVLQAAIQGKLDLGADVPRRLPYPDADRSLRISVGATRTGVEAGSGVLAPPTRLRRLIDARAIDSVVRPGRGRPGFANMLLDFEHTADGAVGSSGSPLMDREGRVVGVMFDRTLRSQGAVFGFDPRRHRGIAVSAAAIRAVLSETPNGQWVEREIDGF